MSSTPNPSDNSGVETVSLPPYQRTLFDVYKLHAELAERVAALREGVNRLHSAIVASIVAASVLLERVESGPRIAWFLPVLAIVVCLSWIVSLSSVTGRLTAKSEVLKELEMELSFNFLQREEEKFKEGRFLRRKWSGFLIPVMFIVLCLGWIVRLWCIS